MLDLPNFRVCDEICNPDLQLVYVQSLAHNLMRATYKDFPVELIFRHYSTTTPTRSVTRNLFPNQNMSSMPKSVEIDPRGDTLIKLKNPKWDLPEWVDSYHPPDPMPDASSSEQSSTAGHQGTIITSNPIFTHQWLVSSNQLRLASRYFDNMFANFAEGEKAEDGKYHVDAEGFHPHALGMALYVLHGVKRPGFFYLSLELVVHVARVVDYYQMHGMIIHLAASYMDEIRDRKGLKSMIALPYGKNVMLWLSAAYVFDQPYTFNECSSAIIMKGAEPLRELELPYPGNLFCKINRVGATRIS